MRPEMKSFAEVLRAMPDVGMDSDRILGLGEEEAQLWGHLRVPHPDDSKALPQLK